MRQYVCTLILCFWISILYVAWPIRLVHTNFEVAIKTQRRKIGLGCTWQKSSMLLASSSLWFSMLRIRIYVNRRKQIGGPPVDRHGHLHYPAPADIDCAINRRDMLHTHCMIPASPLNHPLHQEHDAHSALFRASAHLSPTQQVRKGCKP